MTEKAPPHSLPDWTECSRIINNFNFRERAKQGLETRVLDLPPTSPVPTELHRFIYEYDDANGVRSGWFMHRLERLINETRAAALAAPSAQPPANGTADAWQARSADGDEWKNVHEQLAKELRDELGWQVRALYASPSAQPPACTGTNCTATDQFSHSRECLDEHDSIVRKAALSERPLFDPNNPRNGYCTDREWRSAILAEKSASPSAQPSGAPEVQPWLDAQRWRTMLAMWLDGKVFIGFKGEENPRQGPNALTESIDAATKGGSPATAPTPASGAPEVQPTGWLVWSDGKWAYYPNTLFSVEVPDNTTVRLALYATASTPASGAPEVQPTDAELIETFIANNEQFSRSDMHPDWLHCRDGDGCSTSLRGDLFAATLRHIINGAKA